jgi:hypothetical protein
MTIQDGAPTATGGGIPAPMPIDTGEPDDIRTDIERIRTDLGESVDALAAKADVRARARQAVQTARIRAADRMTGAAHSARHRTSEVARWTADAGRRARAAAPQQARELGQTVRRRPTPTAGTSAAVAAAVAAAMLIRRRRAAKTAVEADAVTVDVDLDRPQPGLTIESLAASADAKTLAGLAARAAAIRAAEVLTIGAAATAERAGVLARWTADSATRMRAAAPQRTRQLAESVATRPVPIAWAGVGLAAAATTAVLIGRRRAATVTTADDGTAVPALSEPDTVDGDVIAIAGEPDPQPNSPRGGRAMRRPAPVAATAAGLSLAAVTAVVIRRRRAARPRIPKRWWTR